MFLLLLSLLLILLLGLVLFLIVVDVLTLFIDNVAAKVIATVAVLLLLSQLQFCPALASVAAVSVVSTFVVATITASVTFSFFCFCHLCYCLNSCLSAAINIVPFALVSVSAHVVKTFAAARVLLLFHFWNCLWLTSLHHLH